MAPGWSSACEVGGHVIGQLDDIRLSHEFQLHIMKYCQSLVTHIVSRIVGKVER